MIKRFIRDLLAGVTLVFLFVATVIVAPIVLLLSLIYRTSIDEPWGCG
jgi:hypothetical protein